VKSVKILRISVVYNLQAGKVVEIIKLKQHLTKEGLEQIRCIKAGMNTGR
jgi:hypothetical protein